jgi:hypothetical protein
MSCISHIYKNSTNTHANVAFKEYVVKLKKKLDPGIDEDSVPEVQNAGQFGPLFASQKYLTLADFIP